MLDTSIEQDFDQLYKQYYSRFITYADTYLKDRALAEDFVSEAFISYWEKRYTLPPDSNPPAYIVTIVRNKCLNHFDHLQVRLRVERDITSDMDWGMSMRNNCLGFCDPENIFSQEIRQIAFSAIRTLPPKTIRTFELSRIQGMSYPEVARTMNMSVKSVEYHISKALSLLCLVLEDFIL